MGQEIIDLSGRATITMHPDIRGPSDVVWYQRQAIQSPSCSWGYIRFPENTKGFFYYHNAPDEPELSAGVRFRICDSAAQFEHGQDLLESTGDVWENLIAEELINDFNKLDINKHTWGFFYSLSDPFNINVASTKQAITYITHTKVIKIAFPKYIFYDRANYSEIQPLTGSIRVQFELSNLPEHKKLGPTLVIRVLGIKEPITVDPLYIENTVLVPVPGTLLRRKNRVVGIPLNRQRMADDLLELVKNSNLSRS